MEIVALVGGLAYFLVAVLGKINRLVVENFYRAELVRQLYSEKDLRLGPGQVAAAQEANWSTALLTSASAQELITADTREGKKN